MRHLGAGIDPKYYFGSIASCIFGHVGVKMVKKTDKMVTKRRKMGVGRRKWGSRSTQRISVDFHRRDEQGAGSLKRLKVLIELMHKRKNLNARRVPCGTVADFSQGISTLRI